MTTTALGYFLTSLNANPSNLISAEAKNFLFSSSVETEYLPVFFQRYKTSFFSLSVSPIWTELNCSLSRTLLKTLTSPCFFSLSTSIG